MGETSIAWTNFSFNPVIGCTKVGPGCDHCYAEAWNTRFSSDGSPPNWGPGAPRRRTTPANWNKVRKWDREAQASGERPWVFCASLADVFDNEWKIGDRLDLWSLVAECKHLRWQFLTKRIGNAAKMLPPRWAEDFRHCGIVATVVTQEECDRDLPKLLEVKRQFGVAWVGLSIEPQLELVRPRVPPDWVITGGESSQRGQSARLYDPAWAHFLIHDGIRQGYAVFVKQMGSNPIGLRLKDRAGAAPKEWPEDLRVREFPTNAAGARS
jgi:protein gp37